MVTLTIFTPTYNRAYILPESYKTLKQQSNKDFLWLIIDDGSTDNTEELVRKWISEGVINIEYIKTPNCGKPSATNLSIEKCKSPLWVCLDSDDHFGIDAVDVILDDFNQIKEDNSYGGIVGNMFTEEGEVFDRQRLPSKIKCIRDIDIRYKYGIYSNLIHVFRTDILKQYRYPIIPNEKFIGESYLYEKMNVQYYIERKPIYFAKYREDGLTAGYLKLHVNNPIGYKILKEQVMIQPKPILHRYKGAIMYIAACKLCENKGIIINSPRKLLTLAAYPLGLIAYYKKYYKLVKKKKTE